MYNKILGCLVGAAAGDVMGAATEARSSNQIIDTFGGKVTEFITPPDDTFGAGNQAGGFTDDFSSAYFGAKEIVDNAGIVNKEIVQHALVKWSKHAVFLTVLQDRQQDLQLKDLQEKKYLFQEG